MAKSKLLRYFENLWAENKIKAEKYYKSKGMIWDIDSYYNPLIAKATDEGRLEEANLYKESKDIAEARKLDYIRNFESRRKSMQENYLNNYITEMRNAGLPKEAIEAVKRWARKTRSAEEWKRLPDIQHDYYALGEEQDFEEYLDKYQDAILEIASVTKSEALWEYSSRFFITPKEELREQAKKVKERKKAEKQADLKAYRKRTRERVKRVRKARGK